MGLRLPRKMGALSLGELILADRAKRTLKVVGKILEFRAGGNAEIGCADLLVVFPAANVTYVDHFCISFL